MTRKTTHLLAVALVLLIALPAGIAMASGGFVGVERTVPGLDGDIRAIHFRSDEPGDEDYGFMLEKTESTAYLWKTENGGASWTANRIWPSSMLLPLGDSFEIMDIGFDDFGGNGWAVGVYHDWTVGLPPTTVDSPFILYTTDGGETWTNQTGNFALNMTGQGALLRVIKYSGGTAVACGENGMLVATTTYGDAAGEWLVLANNDPSKVFRGVAMRSIGGLLSRALAVGDDCEVVYADYNLSTTTWAPPVFTTAQTSTRDLEDVVWTTSGRILAVGSSMWASSVDGSSWLVDYPDTVDTMYSVDRRTASEAVAVGSSGAVFEFTYNDSTNRWETAGVGTRLTTEHLQAVSGTRDDAYWTGGPDSVLFQYGYSDTTRASGTDRYKTALALSNSWPDGGADAVVFATGANFPDALSAAGLCGALESPLLLTGSSLTTEIRNEIERLDPDEFYIIGGYGVVSGLFEDQLSNAYNLPITRIAGANRYHTSRLVAEEIERLTGADFSQTAFVARGDNFADALAVSPFAYSQRIPVLLTDSAALPSDTRTALTGLDIEDAIVAGGTSAVSSAVKDAVEGYTLANGGSTVVRWSGSNRYATAATIARNGMLAGWATPAFVGAATGLNFPDALGGGPVCGAAGGVMLLTDGTTLSGPAATFLSDYSGDIIEVQVFGGSAVVGDAVMNAADALIE